MPTNTFDRSSVNKLLTFYTKKGFPIKLLDHTADHYCQIILGSSYWSPDEKYKDRLADVLNHCGIEADIRLYQNNPPLLTKPVKFYLASGKLAGWISGTPSAQPLRSIPTPAETPLAKSALPPIDQPKNFRGMTKAEIVDYARFMNIPIPTLSAKKKEIIEIILADKKIKL